MSIDFIVKFELQRIENFYRAAAGWDVFGETADKRAGEIKTVDGISN